MPSEKPPIAVLGAGSWGTALALQFARNGRVVRLWGRDSVQLADIRAARCNKRYLPGADFPDNIQVIDDLVDCLSGVQDILVSVPSHGLRETLSRIAPLLDDEARVCWATKGFELSTGKLPHQVASEILGDQRPVHRDGCVRCRDARVRPKRCDLRGCADRQRSVDSGLRRVPVWGLLR